MSIRTRSGSGMALAICLGVLGYVVLHGGGLAGRQAPDFTVRDAYGGSVELSSFRGRPLLMVFWTTSCGYCRYELPIVDRVATEFAPRGLEVVAINIGDVEGARTFMREEHLRLTNTVDEKGEVAQRYGVSGVPKLVFVDREGKIGKEVFGSQSEEALRRWLSRAVPLLP
ncbi:MAG TPA: TlpA disulfide reductase family protein [Bryobacteraceae bacterium]|nr:TlpA disulfide reductase family protein [Bryobacteraceae bacterium]